MHITVASRGAPVVMWLLPIYNTMPLGAFVRFETEVGNIMVSWGYRKELTTDRTDGYYAGLGPGFLLR